MRTCVAGIVTVVVGAGLAACSSDAQTEPSAATPAETSSTSDVCASADALRSSLTALGDVPVVQEGTDALRTAWTTVQEDWAQLADDARADYGYQVDEVQAAADAAEPAVDTAVDDPSAQSLDNAATAVRAFRQDAGALVDEVRSTC